MVFSTLKVVVTPNVLALLKKRNQKYTVLSSTHTLPLIKATIFFRFGSVLENVIFYDEHTREVNFHDLSITENTRASYPLEYIPGAKLPAVGGHPKNIIFLTCDAFGVLPPVAKLTPEQAMYHFIAGYTAKVAGTEVGIVDPVPTFSACFGAAFLPLHPTVYAEMLADKMKQFNSKAWLINTGWTGGKYGQGKVNKNINHLIRM